MGNIMALFRSSVFSIYYFLVLTISVLNLKINDKNEMTGNKETVLILYNQDCAKTASKVSDFGFKIVKCRQDVHQLFTRYIQYMPLDMHFSHCSKPYHDAKF